RRLFSRSAEKEIVIRAHPQVVSHLLNEAKESISKLERQFRKQVVVEEDRDLHLEDVKFLSKMGEELDP
ncbi:hypothetical protein KAX00_04375, partial [bacterium]|nr:hypothetical protein [bacterium]